MSKKVDIPDELVALVEEIQRESGVSNFTAALCFLIKQGHPLVINKFGWSTSKPLVQPPTPVTQPIQPTPSKLEPIEPKVTQLPTKSRADRLRSL